MAWQLGSLLPCLSQRDKSWLFIGLSVSPAFYWVREDHANPDEAQVQMGFMCWWELISRSYWWKRGNSCLFQLETMLCWFRISTLIMWKYLGSDEWCNNVILKRHIPQSLRMKALAGSSTAVNNFLCVPDGENDCSPTCHNHTGCLLFYTCNGFAYKALQKNLWEFNTIHILYINSSN